MTNTRKRQPAGQRTGGQFAPDISGRRGVAAPAPIPVNLGIVIRPLLANSVRVISGRALGGLATYAHVLEGSVVIKTFYGFGRRHAEWRAARWAKPRTGPEYRHPITDVTGNVQRVPESMKPVGARIPAPGSNSIVTLEWQEEDGATRRAEFRAESLPAALFQ